MRTKWREKPSIITAAALLDFYPLFDNDPEVASAAAYLADNENTTPFLRHVARNIAVVPDVVRDDPSEEETRQEIRLFKKRLTIFPRNSINHVEAARLYASRGQNQKAAHHFRVALAISPTNRYVVRSASRFDVHQGEMERAMDTLANGNLKDPWVLAAYVAICQLAGRLDRIPIQSARNLVNSDLLSPQVTELAAALGTVELEDGSKKKARKLFALAGLSPTDNSIAQLRWANEKFSIEFSATLLDSEMTFEARAASALVKEQWNEVVTESRRWLIDEPFATRPAILGCFISAEILEDYPTCIQIARAGLAANPNHPILLNNLSFGLAALGKVADAKVAISAASINATDIKAKAVIMATKGFVAYKEGDIAKGRRSYRESIDLAFKEKDRRLAQAALLHWLIADPAMTMELPAEERAAIQALFMDERRTDPMLRKLYTLRGARVFDAGDAVAQALTHTFEIPPAKAFALK